MKVSSVLINPMGEDDDNYECNYVFDRNLFVRDFQIDLDFDDKLFTGWNGNCGMG